ncbi:MAG TPA: hypothetical protein VKD66_12145, partial [Streptosporangiaceae bacterium]|nr:hypothetical protein [Streptosporangiaceae bacterium]
MSRPTVRRPPRVRKLAAIAGLASLAAGLMLLPAASRSAAAVAAPGAAADRGSSGVTVHGAHLWNWANQQPLAKASTVRVSQTHSLVNELVKVSWSNFTPSINPVSQIWYTFNGSHYAVMVAQCRGLKPTGWKDCYGADQFGVASTSGPDGPMNTAYGVTGADGTGQVNIDVETRLENHFLGCDNKHPCSLVIVPGQGGQRGHCSDHSADVNGNGGTSSPVSTFTSSLSGTGACSWKDRLVVPLRFAKAPSGCPIRNARFS